MKIAVYSGSFNPLHIGHQAIMEYLTESMGFDMVYLIVSPKNPIKLTVSAETGRERYEAAVAAVERHPELKVKVDDIELDMPAPQYTIKTLDALAAREPDNTFTFVLGADNLADIRRWRDYGRILADYGVVVYPRKGFDMKQIKETLMQECIGMQGKQYRICLMEDAPIVDISSTELRAAFAAGIDASAYLM
ncbi:MAG: nicotinate (nicotinamide) nucleotide adenylyltransferase [Bacteroidetes bacterium]|uniref:Probable nicotinate-nucleotide adenylyltransferase n=1 Tax=Candidatus Cryptobacteroides faecigallinarum TaxID=2840763 RepID=A0A9D9ILL1_9BACT|nr:nicotinate (nicotinamide) nucleotide adenylyltransferase [Candidatus Cryptobacteroides faecigallinarum]